MGNSGAVNCIHSVYQIVALIRYHDAILQIDAQRLSCLLHPGTQDFQAAAGLQWLNGKSCMPARYGGALDSIHSVHQVAPLICYQCAIL